MAVLSSADFVAGVHDARCAYAQRRRELEELLVKARKDAQWRTGPAQERAAGLVEGLVSVLTRMPKVLPP